jgi:antitoxin component YwqK of YwqJK toxin-antitoxin module
MKQNKTPTNKQGQLNGFLETYWPNGQLWCKGNYINGNIDGLRESYHMNGRLWEKGNYINGKRDGLWVEDWVVGKIEFYL